jgi:hypothetical protein
MPVTIAPAIGTHVQLRRSGYSPGCAEQATVLEVLTRGKQTVLRVRWSDGRDSFIPASVLARSS